MKSNLCKKGCNLTDDGDLKDYLGTRFTKLPEGSIELSQLRMIEHVLQMVGLDDISNHTKLHDMPAISTTLLDNDPNGEPRIRNWNYHSVVVVLSYLQAMVRPDIAFAVQQCACFCSNPRRQHKDAVKRICRYC